MKVVAEVTVKVADVAIPVRVDVLEAAMALADGGAKAHVKVVVKGLHRSNIIEVRNLHASMN